MQHLECFGIGVATSDARVAITMAQLQRQVTQRGDLTLMAGNGFHFPLKRGCNVYPFIRLVCPEQVDLSHLMWLQAGRLLQVGTPSELLRAPADDYVRQLMGTPLRQAQAVEALVGRQRGSEGA